MRRMATLFLLAWPRICLKMRLALSAIVPLLALSASSSLRWPEFFPGLLIFLLPIPRIRGVLPQGLQRTFCQVEFYSISVQVVESFPKVADHASFLLFCDHHIINVHLNV